MIDYKRILFFLFLLVFALESYAANIATQHEKSLFVRGVVHILFEREGKNAVSLDDMDGNDIPDQVEDIAKQISATYFLYCQILDFPDPILSSRYSGVKYIEVNIKHRDTLGGFNGIAYDEIINYGGADKIKGDKAIRIDISSSIFATTNHTPAHEMFHLIQNGITYFKNRWYTEGMARWSENALKKGGLGAIGSFPQSKYSEKWKRDLFKKTYSAEKQFWNIIARLDDKTGLLPDLIDPDLEQLRYSDGSRVLNDKALTGAGLMREILIELGKIDDVVFHELNYITWNEINQFSTDNNEYIYYAVQRVVKNRTGRDIP